MIASSDHLQQIFKATGNIANSFHVLYQKEEFVDYMI